MAKIKLVKCPAAATPAVSSMLGTLEICMGENSKIEWCDHTLNPWIGCQKVSPGCDNCYAEAMMDHRYKRVQWGPHGERQRTSEQNWRLPIRWNAEARAFRKENGH